MSQTFERRRIEEVEQAAANATDRRNLAARPDPPLVETVSPSCRRHVRGLRGILDIQANVANADAWLSTPRAQSPRSRCR